MGILSRLLGIVNAEPPKMMPAAQPHQFQFPMGPGGVTEDPPPWAQAPTTLPDDEYYKLSGEPLSALQYRGQMDMGPSSPSYGAGDPVRGMEPASAPEMPMPQQSFRARSDESERKRHQRSFVPTPNPELAALLSRLQDSLDAYRSGGQQELAGLRAQRDRFTARTNDLERRRRGGTGGGGY